MEKIEVLLKRDPGPIDCPFERFYLSAMKYRLWRFFIAPLYLLASVYFLGKHPITWVAVGFTAFFLFLWTKTYIKYYRTLRASEIVDEDDGEVGDSFFIATSDGFTIDPDEDEALIEWPILSRFDESKNFFAFTIQGYPTLTVGKRHFSSEEASFVRRYAAK